MRKEQTNDATVLIIDDEPAVQRLVSLVLRSAGFSTCTASDGSDGLQQLERCRPDVIVLDVAMPRMDGPTFLGVIRRRGCESPVLILSGQDHATTKRLPAEAHLPKPFAPDDLVLEVQRLIAA
jgi:two-component system response regulator MprA